MWITQACDSLNSFQQVENSIWANIITIKITNDLNYFSLCALNLFIQKFHNLIELL